MPEFDPRLTPARLDLAARHLQGQVEAERFVDGVPRQVVTPLAPVRREPSPDAALDTEALKGERVTVYESTEEGWSWAQLDDDGYVGWLPSEALGPPDAPPTSKVCALRTLVFPGASIKAPPVEALSLGCRVAVKRTEGMFAVAGYGFIPARHLAPLEAFERDPVAVAERFAGVPYLWGGKSSLGLDCSALVQIALTACGHKCPRDSDMQERMVGQQFDGGPEALARGDLIFWPGHVAMVRDGATLIHANAHHMAVAIEPITEALARIRDAGSEPRSFRRMDAQ